MSFTGPSTRSGSDPPGPLPDRSTRPWLLAGLVALGGLGLLGLLLALREGGGDDSPVAAEPGEAASPAGLSTALAALPGAEEQAAQAAADAYRGLLETVDRLHVAGDADQRPVAEVEAEIRRYAVGSAGAVALDTVLAFSREGVTQDGAALVVDVAPIAVELEPDDPRQEGIPEITLQTCLDLSGQDQRLPDGTPLTAPGTPERVVSRPVVRFRSDGALDGWYVERIDIRPGESC